VIESISLPLHRRRGLALAAHPSGAIRQFLTVSKLQHILVAMPDEISLAELAGDTGMPEGPSASTSRAACWTAP